MAAAAWGTIEGMAKVGPGEPFSDESSATGSSVANIDSVAELMIVWGDISFEINSVGSLVTRTACLRSLLQSKKTF